MDTHPALVAPLIEHRVAPVAFFILPLSGDGYLVGKVWVLHGVSDEVPGVGTELTASHLILEILAGEILARIEEMDFHHLLALGLRAGEEDVFVPMECPAQILDCSVVDGVEVEGLRELEDCHRFIADGGLIDIGDRRFGLRLLVDQFKLRATGLEKSFKVFSCFLMIHRTHQCAETDTCTEHDSKPLARGIEGFIEGEGVAGICHRHYSYYPYAGPATLVFTTAKDSLYFYENYSHALYLDIGCPSKFIKALPVVNVIQ